MSRLEVTTSQWMEFVNTFASQPDLIAPGGPEFVWGPTIWWGAVRDTSYSGPGIRWRTDPGTPQAGLVPVNGISWREAAIYCNWLNNGKPSQWSAVQNGSYDTSTFSTNPDGTFNDQLTHNPGAQFWIPTLDEMLKAAHYDPNRYGPGQGGWWEYSHRSDTPPMPGLPGIGQTMAGLQLGNFEEWDIPLGAYADVQSPWGLWDTSGGASEWTEESYQGIWRRFDGTMAGFTYAELDSGWLVGTDHPGGRAWGLRIASVIPAPGTLWIAAGLFCACKRRRRT
jgi:formylglycine-generating enzyme required for sulfatase activity